jgi:hypothetical protein
LILALMVPSVVIIIYGIILIGVSIEPENLHYLLLTFFVRQGKLRINRDTIIVMVT